MRKLHWLAVPLVFVSLLVSGSSQANALEITQRKVVVTPHGHYATCYYDYNWFEELVLGKLDGPRSGQACR